MQIFPESQSYFYCREVVIMRRSAHVTLIPAHVYQNSKCIDETAAPPEAENLPATSVTSRCFFPSSAGHLQSHHPTEKSH